MTTPSKPADESDGRGKQSDMTSAAIGGASGGTILVGIGDALGSHTTAGQICIIAAPSVSVAAAAVWRAVVRYFDERRKSRKFKEVKTEMERLLNDPNLTDDQKTEIRYVLTQIQRRRLNDALQSIGMDIEPSKGD
jgi:hypothetical protein